MKFLDDSGLLYLWQKIKNKISNTSQVLTNTIVGYTGDTIPEGYEETDLTNVVPLATTTNDGLISSNDKNKLDNLAEIETTTNANGTAIKYSDGRLECYHFLDLGTNLAITRTYGNIYITQNPYSWTFPVKFIEPPTDVQVTGVLSGGIGGATLSSIPSTTGISAMYMWHSQSYTFSGKTSGIYLKATGRWK